EQGGGHRLEGAGHRRHLGQDVDAVLVVVDHLLQAADLALDPAQAREVPVLVRRVAVHIRLRVVTRKYDTPAGYHGGPAATPSPRPSASGRQSQLLCSICVTVPAHWTSLCSKRGSRRPELHTLTSERRPAATKAVRGT